MSDLWVIFRSWKAVAAKDAHPCCTPPSGRWLLFPSVPLQAEGTVKVYSVPVMYVGATQFLLWGIEEEYTEVRSPSRGKWNMGRWKQMPKLKPQPLGASFQTVSAAAAFLFNATLKDIHTLKGIWGLKAIRRSRLESSLSFHHLLPPFIATI